MAKRRPVVIISADKEIIELAEENKVFKIIGVLDSRKNVDGLGYSVLGADSEWNRLSKAHKNLKVILAVDPADRKEKLAYHYGINSLAALISADAYISPSACLEAGCLV